MKKLCKLILPVFLVFLLSGCSFQMENRYLLTRYTPSFDANTGFLEPEYLQPELWSQVVWEEFEDGVLTNLVFIRRGSSYELEYWDENRQAVKETLRTSSGGGSGLDGDFDLYQEGRDGEAYGTPTVQGRYYWDEEGRLERLVTELSVFHAAQYGEPIQELRFQYDDQDRLIRQLQMKPDGGRSYRTYTYSDNGDLEKVEEYTADGTLLGYVLYDYQVAAHMTLAQSYDAQGKLTGYSETLRGDPLPGNVWKEIEQVETFDEEGTLLSRISYNYEQEKGLSRYELLAVILICCSLGFWGIHQIWQLIQNRRYYRSPEIEIRAKLVHKEMGSGGLWTDGSWFGTFQTETGNRFQLAMERDHYYGLPEEVWGTLRYKGGWMRSFYSDEEEKNEL